MDLQSLNSLGLPGWFIIAATLVFILKQVGLLDFLTGYLKSQSQLEREQIEFEQRQEEAKSAAEQSEQIALWSQMTQLQSMTLNQNETLLRYIVNTSSEWHEKHSSKLEEIAKQQLQIIHDLKHLTSKFTVMFGIIEQKWEK